MEPDSGPKELCDIGLTTLGLSFFITNMEIVIPWVGAQKMLALSESNPIRKNQHKKI